MGIQNFQIYKYTITGKIITAFYELSGNECLEAFGVAIVFAVIMIAASSAVFSKEGYLADVYRNWNISRNYHFTIYYYVEISAAGEGHLPPIGVLDET